MVVGSESEVALVGVALARVALATVAREAASSKSEVADVERLEDRICTSPSGSASTSSLSEGLLATALLAARARSP